MHKEFTGSGDHAEITLQTNAIKDETFGIEGNYHVECRDADGNLKWTEEFDNKWFKLVRFSCFLKPCFLLQLH